VKNKIDIGNLAGGGQRTPTAEGRGRNQGDAPGSGPGGICICPKCKTEVSHETGVPCNERKCPKCGATMTRKITEKLADIVLPMRVIETTKMKE
jgi:PHP family Zn ribbon phosphoesterase